MIFKNYFIKKKIKSYLNNAIARKSRFYSLNDAKTFLVSFNISDMDDVIRCIKRLKKLNKKVYLSVIIPRKQKKVEYDIPDCLIVKETDLDAKGEPPVTLCEAFDSIKADVIIDLTRKDDTVMHYLQLRHPALFKIGTKSSIRHLFDLTVTMKEEDHIPQFFETLLFYLQTIRSN